MNRFSGGITSPHVSICGGYLYMVFLFFGFYLLGFGRDTAFLQWGTPVNFMGTQIDDDGMYYLLLVMLFVHQLVNNWVNTVVSPWLMHCIQDPSSKDIVYSRQMSIAIINATTLYSNVNTVIIVGSILSHIGFFQVFLLANIISGTVINWQYIRDRYDNIPLATTCV